MSIRYILAIAVALGAIFIGLNALDNQRNTRSERSLQKWCESAKQAGFTPAQIRVLTDLMGGVSRIGDCETDQRPR